MALGLLKNILKLPHDQAVRQTKQLVLFGSIRRNAFGHCGFKLKET
jgi:hypothetical protein